MIILEAEFAAELGRHIGQIYFAIAGLNNGGPPVCDSPEMCLYRAGFGYDSRQVCIYDSNMPHLLDSYTAKSAELQLVGRSQTEYIGILYLL